jgi:probable HAF family extracellular repeat protein
VANNAIECFEPEALHSFLLLRDGKYIAFDVPGSLSTSALGINDDGVIVGTYTDKHGVDHGFKAVPKDDL